jgi:hypothetical protein
VFTFVEIVNSLPMAHWRYCYFRSMHRIMILLYLSVCIETIILLNNSYNHDMMCPFVATDSILFSIVFRYCFYLNVFFETIIC